MSPAAVRVLAIETSKSQASIAVLESGVLVAAREAAGPKQSAERLLPMIAELLAELSWPRTSLARLGVAVGPGSFTGLRVGIACAQGLALGLDIPLIGVTSLAAMARCVPSAIPGVRCPVLDARRSEVFVGAYAAGASTREAIAPLSLGVNVARRELEQRLGTGIAWIGAGASLIGAATCHDSPETREPSAVGVALLAAELDPAQHPATPVYVRDAGATLPNLGTPTPH